MVVGLGGPLAGYIMLQCYNIHQDNIVFISFYVDNTNTLPRVKFIILKQRRKQDICFLLQN